MQRGDSLEFDFKGSKFKCFCNGYYLDNNELIQTYRKKFKNQFITFNIYFLKPSKIVLTEKYDKNLNLF